MYFLAKKHPKAAVRIIEKLLPLTVNGTPGMFGGNHISTVNVVSVPSGSFLSQEDIDRMRGRPTILDHETAAPPKQLEICPETEPVIEQSVQNAREFEPQTERERRLLAELEALSPDQRLFGDNDKSNNDDAA